MVVAKKDDVITNINYTAEGTVLEVLPDRLRVRSLYEPYDIIDWTEPYFVVSNLPLEEDEDHD